MVDVLSAAGRAAARLTHAFVAEFRRLDAPPPAPEPAKGEVSTTQARIESTWQRSTTAPASPRAFGFRRG